MPPESEAAPQPPSGFSHAPPGLEIDWAEVAKWPASKQEALQRRLEEYHELGRRNPLTRYAPHPKQAIFHGLPARWRCFLGGNRSGKSVAALVDDLIQAVDEDCLPDHLRPYKRWQPPFRCRIVAPKFNENHEGVTFPTLRDWVPRDQLQGGSWDKAFSKQLRRLSFANGSWFQFMTFEQDLDAFMGASLHRVHFDEEPLEREMFRVNRQRLIDTEGDFVLSMTPENGVSWSYERFLARVEHDELEPGIFYRDDIGVVQVSMRDNPHIARQEITDAEAELTEEEKAALIEGRYMHFAGAVYREWDDDAHLVDPPSLSHIEGQDIVIGIDPGVQTTAVAFCAFDGDNHMLVFDELYLHDKAAIPDAASEAIRGKLAEWGIDVAYYVIDPSARNRTLTTAENVQAAYQRQGIYASPGQNDVRAGVFEIKRRLESRSLLVSKACQNWRYERKRYRVLHREDGQFAVVKKDDHLLDATRYAAMERPWHRSVAPDAEPRGWTYGRAPDAEFFDQSLPPSPPLGALT